MRAVIFAAGCSARLEELTEKLPKCCLKLDDEQTILQRILKLLEMNRVQQVVIVTGFASQNIEKEVEAWQEKFELIETVYNPHYEARNNIYTAYLVRDRINSDTIIINSDLVFHPDILKKAVGAAGTTDESFLLADDQKQLVEEDMKILADDSGKVTRIHKSLDHENARGEYIGILRLSGNDLAIFKESLKEMIDREDFGKYYEDAIDEKISGMHIKYMSTEGIPWAEVDTKSDYKRAKELIGRRV